MKKYVIFIFITIRTLAFSQTTSLEIDNQNPGWLSSKINYEEQLSLKNLTITGYINGDDLEFIKILNTKHSLNGVINIENVKIVSGGSVVKDNTLPSQYAYNWNRTQKFIYPNTLQSTIPGLHFPSDSLIWTNTKSQIINLRYMVGDNACYVYIPEGCKKINGIPDNSIISLPNSIDSIYGTVGHNVKILSHITNPKSVYSKYEYYYSTLDGSHRSFYSMFENSMFYVPKNKKEEYQKSDFGIMKLYNYGSTAKANNNQFVEYYDIDSTIIINNNISIYIGDKDSIKTIIYPDDALVSYIEYNSNHSEVVKVEKDGVFSAQNIGQVDISVKPHLCIEGLETKIGLCHVNVLAHTEGIKMPTSIKMHINEEKNINACTLPEGITDNKIMYKSSNPLIATIDEEGNINGCAKGSCIITGTTVDGGYTSECEIQVQEQVEAISFEKHSITLKVNESEPLKTIVYPITADNKEICYSSNDEDVATIDKNGLVKGVKAGEVWIKAKSEDNPYAVDSCKVIIIQPVTGLTISDTYYTLKALGEKYQLEAKVIPENASNKEIKWTSSNESVCLVSNGTIVAVGYGTSVIIATSSDGGYLAICTVTVEDTTGIEGITNDKDSNVQYFDSAGRPLSSPGKGITIIKRKDGSKEKLLIK